MKTDLQRQIEDGPSPGKTLGHRVYLTTRTTGRDLRHSGRSEQGHRCPTCSSIIYSRRNRLCGVCGHVLPAERLFTPSEAKAITRLLTLEKQRYRQWLAKGFAQALAVMV